MDSYGFDTQLSPEDDVYVANARNMSEQDKLASFMDWYYARMAAMGIVLP